jgi:hypothetical protein
LPTACPFIVAASDSEPTSVTSFLSSLPRVNDLGGITLSLPLQSHSSAEFSSCRSAIKTVADEAGRWGTAMRDIKDWIADWKRWSLTERCLAIALVILSLMIPLGLLIRGSIIGT